MFGIASLLYAFWKRFKLGKCGQEYNQGLVKANIAWFIVSIGFFFTPKPDWFDQQSNDYERRFLIYIITSKQKTFFLCFLKFVKHPQTTFHAYIMRDTQIIRSKILKMCL